MLRGLRQLTIDIELPYEADNSDDSDESDDSNESDDPDAPDDGDSLDMYALCARKAITAVCLAMAGASKLEELTIKVTFVDPQASDADMAEIMWPLIFLRSDVVVRFEGLSEVLQRETSADYEERARQRALLPHRKKAAFPSLIAEVKKHCAEKNDNIMELLAKLRPLGVWLDMADIVNLTLKWRTLQRNADSFEGLNGPRRGRLRDGLRRLE